jgi:hypothetical protein
LSAERSRLYRAAHHKMYTSFNLYVSYIHINKKKHIAAKAREHDVNTQQVVLILLQIPDEKRIQEKG